MPANPPQTVSHTHEAIMNFMVANPAMPLGAVAEYFGYSQSWLSIIVHSNAFQARLREKHDELFGELAINITDRMTAVAHKALDIINDGLHAQPNPYFALEVADKVLHRLGYAPQKAAAPAGPVNVAFVVNQSELADARAMITTAPARALYNQTQEHETSPQPQMGSADTSTSLQQELPASAWTKAPGDSL